LGESAADKVLGINGFLSRRLRQLSSLLATTATSFAKAAELLRHCSGVRLGEETIRQCCHRIGEHLQEQQGAQPQVIPTFHQAEGETEFHVDAAKVNILDEGWKDVKAVIVVKRPLGKPTTVDRWDDRALPESTARCCFARVEGIDDFQQRWRPWMAHLGITETSAIDVHGDGAEWIWNAANDQFPGCLQSLDPFHGYLHLAEALKVVHGEQTAAFADAFAAGRRALLQEGWSGLVSFYGKCLLVADAPGRTAMEKMLAYFSQHAGRMDYPQRLQQGRSLGSGPIEGFCKTLGLRLKSRGARWKLTNANKMAAAISYFETAGMKGAYSLN
jgi:hypothetical protein